MRKGVEQFLKIFKREYEKRFQLVSKDGTPLEQPKEEQDKDSLSEEKLTDEEMEEMELTEEELQEEELASEIGDFLDGIVEKLESEEGDRGDK